MPGSRKMPPRSHLPPGTRRKPGHGGWASSAWTPSSCCPPCPLRGPGNTFRPLPSYGPVRPERSFPLWHATRRKTRVCIGRKGTWMRTSLFCGSTERPTSLRSLIVGRVAVSAGGWTIETYMYEHAFRCLREGKSPVWRILVAFETPPIGHATLAALSNCQCRRRNRFTRSRRRGPQLGETTRQITIPWDVPRRRLRVKRDRRRGPPRSDDTRQNTILGLRPSPAATGETSDRSFKVVQTIDILFIHEVRPVPVATPSTFSRLSLP